MTTGAAPAAGSAQSAASRRSRPHPLSAGRRRFYRWSLRRRVGAIFLVAAIVLAAIIASVVAALYTSVTRGNQVVYRWAPATLAVQTVLTDMINEETGIRGFALSDRTAALQPYAEFIIQRPHDEQQLRTYITGHPALLADLAAFDQATDTWRDQTALPLIKLTVGHDPSALARIDSLADKGRFDAVRVRAAALMSGVQGELSQARDQRRDAVDNLIMILSIAAGLLIAGALLIWRVLHRWVLAPVDHLAGQARTVAQGEPDSVIEPYGPPEFQRMGRDVEWMRRTAADALIEVEAASAELARSNADLEQFAYVASHDLSEPLRKIANFTQLLERQYGPQLDDKARQYIGFAVDGAKRMQQLIADLLALSRVGRSTESFRPVNTADVLDRALADLDAPLRECGGRVERGVLPVVRGDPALLTALFGNLVGNAIKYRGPEPPVARVGAEPGAGGEWVFTVADNGIGIEPRYAERIFAIFQRLHLRDAYPGTGIGLALCRRIVEFHGGRIWLDTQAGAPGATFRFTLDRMIDLPSEGKAAP